MQGYVLRVWLRDDAESICYSSECCVFKVNDSMHTFQDAYGLKLEMALRKLINGPFPESKKTSENNENC